MSVNQKNLQSCLCLQVSQPIFLPSYWINLQHSRICRRNNVYQQLDLMDLRQIDAKVLLILLICIQLSLSACSTSCNTCIQQDIYNLSPYCTSCKSGQYLSGYHCYDCSQCPSCNECSTGVNPTLIIVLCITITLASILIICCIHKLIKKRNAPPVEEPVNPVSPQPLCSGINLIPYSKAMSSSWKRSPYKLDNQENCAICLDNNACLLTSCQHYFHPKCIYEWVAKNQSCPMCKSENLMPLKLYCKRCSQSYKVVNFAIIRKLTVLGKQDHCFACQNEQI